MLNIHLKIKAFKYEIYKDIYSISARDKINSVQIYETDFIMDRILNEMDLWEIGRFLLNMFNLYSWEFKTIYSSEYYNWNIIKCCYFTSNPIIVSANNIAISLPSKIRKKYFVCNPWDWKWFVNPDLYILAPEENEKQYMAN